jgi:CRP-like cAMP-binding protein
MQGIYRDFEIYDVICREGEPSTDLFFLKHGKLLICTINGTEVKVIARISKGEFIGELSFFDDQPRSSFVVALEKSRVIQIPKSEMAPLLPSWYNLVGINLTKKIRLLDSIIHDSHIRRHTMTDYRPLTIEEQRKIYEILTK